MLGVTSSTFMKSSDAGAAIWGAMPLPLAVTAMSWSTRSGSSLVTWIVVPSAVGVAGLNFTSTITARPIASEQFVVHAAVIGNAEGVPPLAAIE